MFIQAIFVVQIDILKIINSSAQVGKPLQPLNCEGAITRVAMTEETVASFVQSQKKKKKETFAQRHIMFKMLTVLMVHVCICFFLVVFCLFDIRKTLVKLIDMPSSKCLYRNWPAQVSP